MIIVSFNIHSVFLNSLKLKIVFEKGRCFRRNPNGLFSRLFREVSKKTRHEGNFFAIQSITASTASSRNHFDKGAGWKRPSGHSEGGLTLYQTTACKIRKSTGKNAKMITLKNWLSFNCRSISLTAHWFRSKKNCS